MSGPLWTVLLKYARIRKEVDVVVGLSGGGEKLKADSMADPDGSATAHIRVAAGVCEFHKG